MYKLWRATRSRAPGFDDVIAIRERLAPLAVDLQPPANKQRTCTCETIAQHRQHVSDDILCLKQRKRHIHVMNFYKIVIDSEIGTEDN